MRKILFAIIFVAAALGGVAQNKNTARKLFNEGNFAEAKPMFEKLLKRTPNNSEYNYWYAACCIETGDSVDVTKMLEFAASRKIVNAHRYLGDYCFAKENYPRATECYDEFLLATKDDSLRVVYSGKAILAKNITRMVQSTQKVCVVDSFVVDEANFLSAYRLGEDVGVVTTNALYFDDPMLPGYINETERGLDIFFSDYSEYNDSVMKLYRNSKVAGEWGTPVPLEGFDTYGNDDYPFMCSDGVTLYFASDGDGSIGGYDIFMTRMDTESGRFLRPDNVGMPFNSTANDYMLVIDEVANLGWFATDRNQPEGYVCVYVFVPNAKNERHDIEEMGYERQLSYSKLASIEATQGDVDALRKARQQLTMMLYSQADNKKKGDFLFIIDDTRDYTKISDFKSKEARELFIKWQSRKDAFARDLKTLEQQRDAYASANVAGKKRMTASILALEEKIENEERALNSMELEVRRLEQEKLYK